MKNKIVLIFLTVSVIAASFMNAHKFYVSVTNINYSEEDAAFQVTTRIFIDDLENVLKERYDINMGLATDRESELADMYVERYLRSKFVLQINGNVVAYDFLGKRYDNDVVICYLEVPKVILDEAETMAVQNEILTDLFEEQKNIVHIKWKDNKKSFVLIRDNNKGMLNL